MSFRAVVTRIRHAVLGKPLTHDEARHVSDAQARQDRAAARYEADRPNPPVFPSAF